MRRDSAKILHELTTWQVAAAIFFEATFYKPDPKKVRYQCALGDDPKKFKEHTLEELWDILMNQTAYYKIKKLSKSKHHSYLHWNETVTHKVNQDYIMEIVNAFNKKSAQDFFKSQIPGLPRPRIGPFLHSGTGKVDSDGKPEPVFRYLETTLDMAQQMDYQMGLALDADKKRLEVFKAGIDLAEGGREHKDALIGIFEVERERYEISSTSHVIAKDLLDNPARAIEFHKKLKKRGMGGLSSVTPYVEDPIEEEEELEPELPLS